MMMDTCAMFYPADDVMNTYTAHHCYFSWNWMSCDVGANFPTLPWLK